jgi:RNA polymerase sigma-70 factor (ECF subfamily)
MLDCPTHPEQPTSSVLQNDRRIKFSRTATPNNAMAETDADLVQLLQQGQTAALGKLYDRYAGLVYGIALKMLTNASEAEDLTQEIFLILWQRNTYQASRGSMGSYLATLTRSRALDRLRVGSNRQRILNQWSEDVSPRNPSVTPFDQASIDERKEQVRHALQDLPAKHRQVLELMYFEGLSQSQVAHRLDTPLGTVKTWARKGLLQLNQQLQALQER